MTTDNVIRTDAHSADGLGAPLSMTAAQRGIYYAQQLDPDVPMAVAAFAEFRDAVDGDIMQRAVAVTCSRASRPSRCSWWWWWSLAASASA